MAKDIRVSLELDNRQYNRNIKQSANETNKFTREAKSGLGGLKTAFAALGGAAVIKGIVSIGSKFQDLQSSLNIVTGSADAGAAAFGRINELALTTQFGVEELTTGFIQLKGAGVDPAALGFDSLEDVLFSFSNSASVTVDQMRTFQALLDATSRTVAGGLNLQDLIRIQDSGIPVFTIFNKTLGISRKELTELGQSAEGATFLLKVLNQSSDALFAGALENRLTNTSTLFSNLVIAVKNTASSLFIVFQPAIDAVLIKLTELSVGLFDVIVGTKTFGQFVDEVAPSLGNLVRVLDKFSIVIFLLTAPTAIRALIGILGSLGNTFLRLTGITLTTNLALTGFARFSAQVISIAKGLFTVTNILAAVVANLGLEFIKLNGQDFTFGEKLFIAVVQTIGDLVGLISVISLVGTNIGGALQKGIIAGFKGENVIIEIGDEIAKQAAIGGALGDSIANSLLGEDLRAKLSENAKKNVIDPIEKTLEQVIKEQQEALVKLLKTQGQNEASIELDEIGKKYKEQYEALLASIEKTGKGADKVLTPLQKFTEQLMKMTPGTDTFKQGLESLNELLGGDKTVAGLQAYTTGLNALKDAFNVGGEFEEFSDSLEGLSLTTQEYAIFQRALNALIEKYPGSTEEAIEAQEKLNEALGENEAFNIFIDNLNTAVDALGNDLVNALQQGEKAGDVFKNFFKQMIRSMIADLLKLLLFIPILEMFGFSAPGGTITGFSGKGLLGKMGVKATGAGGGALMPNRPVLVGESGREVFTPSSSGTLTANHSLGTTVNYTINALDTASFESMLSRNPQFVHAVVTKGASTLPSGRRF